MPGMLYCYVEPGDNNEAVVVKRSREWLMQHYYPYWAKRMKDVGLPPDPEQCIEDWLVVHWGWTEQCE